MSKTMCVIILLLSAILMGGLFYLFIYNGTYQEYQTELILTGLVSLSLFLSVPVAIKKS